MDGDASRSTRYRIVLRGELGDDFRVIFEGMGMARADGTTVLTGDVDQAQLAGVIARVQNLGIELVSVEPTSTA